MKLLLYFLSLTLFSTLAFNQERVTGEVEKKSSEINIAPRKEVEDELRFLLIKSVFAQWPDVARKRNRYLRVDDEQKPRTSLKKRLNAEGFIFKSSFLDRGLLVWVSKFRWINDSEVDASAGYYLGNMASGSCTYKLKKVEALWQIVSFDNCSIS